MAEQMAFQASHDGLTGLANRSLFMGRLEEAMQHVGRRRASLALLFIDLDRFKLVNDRADHSAGDLVLQEMANRLTAMTRGVDLVARFGGDEFVAFAEVDHERDALDMAERIRAGLSEPVAIGNGTARGDGQRRRRHDDRRVDVAGRAVAGRRQRHVRGEAVRARSGRALPQQRARARQPHVGTDPRPRPAAQRRLSSRRYTRAGPSAASFSAMERKACAVSLSGSNAMTGRPSSPPWRTALTSGT